MTTQDRQNALAVLADTQAAIDGINGRSLPAARLELHLTHAQVLAQAATAHALLDIAAAIRETRSTP